MTLSFFGSELNQSEIENEIKCMTLPLHFEYTTTEAITSVPFRSDHPPIETIIVYIYVLYVEQ